MSQYDTYETGAYEGAFEGQFEEEGGYETGLNELQETELAAELLEITNEAELEEFLGGLVKAAGSFIKSPVGQALGGVLKDVAKTALPVVGGALGSMVAPGVGTAIGSKLGSMAGNLVAMGYGTERQQEQFEVARKVIQLTTNAAQAAQAAPPHLPPQVVAQQAVSQAAHELGISGETQEMQGEYGYRSRYPRRYGRGYGSSYSDYDNGRAMSGRWIRRGRRIIVLGV